MTLFLHNKVMKSLNLSPEEVEQLQDWMKNSPVLVLRLKAQVVLLRWKKLSLQDISELTGKSVRSIKRWLRSWREYRLGAITTEKFDNTNSRKMPVEIKEQVTAALVGKPSEYDLPGEFWTLPSVREYLKVTFDIEYSSDRSIHMLLRGAGLSFHYGSKFNIRRDEEQIAARMQAIAEELAQLPAQMPVYTSDEVRLDSDTDLRKAWMKKGEKTKISDNRQAHHQSYIGFLRLATGVCAVEEIARSDTQSIIEPLQNLLAKHPGEQVTVIWDNAQWHKSNELKEHLGLGGSLENLHLIWLPPYAPDHNPIEHVWNAAKGQAANICHVDFDHTKEKFVEYISSRTFNYVLN